MTAESETDLDPLLRRLSLANARRVWPQLVQHAEQEHWSYTQLLQTLFAEEVAHRRSTKLQRAVRAAHFPFLRTVEEFDFSYQSILKLTTNGSLLAPDFVTKAARSSSKVNPAAAKRLSLWLLPIVRCRTVSMHSSPRHQT